MPFDPGFFGETHWTFTIQFNDEDGNPLDLSTLGSLLAIMYDTDRQQAFVWRSVASLSTEGTIDTTDLAIGQIHLEATQEQHEAVPTGEPYTWTLYDIGEVSDPRLLCLGRAYIGRPGESDTTFEVIESFEGSEASGVVVGIRGADGDITAELLALQENVQTLHDEVEDDAAQVAADRISTTASAALASAKAAAAALSADEAEAWAALSQTAASENVYPDIATGLAAVADGEIFTVAAAVGSGRYATHYKRLTVSTYEELTSLPDETLIEQKADLTELAFYGTPFLDDAYWAEVPAADADGNVALGVDRDGNTHGHMIGTFDGPWNEMEYSIFLEGDYRFGVIDADGVLMEHITREGVGWYGPQPAVYWTVDVRGADGARQVYLQSEEYGEVQITSDMTADHTARLNGIELTVMRKVGSTVTKFRNLLHGASSLDIDIEAILHVPASGQSNSRGTDSFLILDTAPEPGRAISFNVGVKTLFPRIIGQQEAEVLPDESIVSWIDARERIWDGEGECPLTSCAEQMCRVGGLNSVEGVLVSHHGMGGVNYDHLAPGTQAYLNLIKTVRRAHFMAITRGLAYEVPFVFWDQGEGNVNDAAGVYKAHLEELQAALTVDINAITGGSGEVPLVLMQTSNWTVGGGTTSNIGQDQLQAMTDNPGKIYCLGPKYQWETKSDGVHILYTGSNHYGAYLGRAGVRLHASQVPASMYALDAVRSGAIVDMQFNTPVEPLVFDTVLVSDPGNKGITFYQTGGNAVTVSSVAVLGTDSVRVTLSDVPTGTAQKIGIAWEGLSGAHGGPTTGPRSCIRDSSLDLSVAGDPLVNWACHQLIGIT